MHRYFFPLLLLAALPASAQDELKALNDHFHGTVVFSIDRRDRLVAELHDGSGVFRRDAAYLDQLDPALFAYSPEEQVVMVRCQDAEGKCIEKELLKTGAIVPTGRMNLPVPEGDANGAKAIELLVRLVQAELADMNGTGSGTKRRK